MPQISIGPIEVVVLIVGITQVLKEVFTIGGKEARALTFIVAFGLTTAGYAYTQGLIPEVAQPYVELVAVGLGGAVSAMGYYDLIFKGRGSAN